MSQRLPVKKSSPLHAACGALAGIVLAYAAGALTPNLTHAAIVAPLGASAVLAFAVPGSPLATPRAIVLGNTLSACIGVAISCLPGLPPAPACGLAVALAIAAMQMTRSLHPPGGASALTAVLLHPAAQGYVSGLLFPFFPVAVNSIALTLTAIFYHRCTGHAYPHHAAPPTVTRIAPSIRRFTQEDIATALKDMPETLDVDPADVMRLVALVERSAEARMRPPGS